MPTAALVVRCSQLIEDPAIHQGGRGKRKIVVAEVREDEERLAETPEWAPPTGGGRSPVLQGEGWECSVFSRHAPQDRHLHPEATEVYHVLIGSVRIEVEGESYTLKGQDFIIIPPGSAHMVMGSDQPFICWTAKMNCGEGEDKVLAPTLGP